MGKIEPSTAWLDDTKTVVFGACGCLIANTAMRVDDVFQNRASYSMLQKGFGL
jgi:hypothetical protein